MPPPPPTKGSKSASRSVNSSSFLGLKAEIAKQESEVRKGGRSAEKGRPRAEKKPTVWQRQNPGLAARAARDARPDLATSTSTLEASRAALERKAALYDKLRRGKTGGLEEEQIAGGLIDWDRKAEDGDEWSEQDSEGDESSSLPLGADDPIIEYRDEFGRTRTARRSEVPRNLRPPPAEPEPERENLIYGDANYFPVYTPDPAAIAAARAAAEASPALHFDATAEVRTKGAGFYQFSKDEETRLRQMEELKKAREETETKRKERGSEEVEGEGDASGGGAPRKRPLTAVERRKEERRKEIEAKKRKMLGDAEVERLKQEKQQKRVDGFLEALEKDAAGNNGSTTGTSCS